MADIARAGVEARARGGNAGRAGWAWRHARNAPAPPARPTARAHVERTHRAAQPPALHHHSSSFSYWVRHPDTQSLQLPHLPAPFKQYCDQTFSEASINNADAGDVNTTGLIS